MFKVKKLTNQNSSNLNNNRNNLGIWETIDLLTKHQINNSGRDVYDNIDDWLHKVSNKLNQNKFHEKDSNTSGYTYSSQDELTPDIDSATGEMTPKQRSKDKINLKQEKMTIKSENVNRVLDEELMLPLNELLANESNGVDAGTKKKKKKKKKSGKLPKIIKNGKMKGEPFEDEELYKSNYFGPLVDCNFNLPRVSAQLEKLMGTNIVRLTDRNYMLQLRTRIQEEYHSTLQKRIHQREQKEDERQKELILNGSYSIHNCPPRLIIVHSVALAREMERERNLIMSGKGETCPHDLADHPVFIINQQTNAEIAKARSKLKTTREKNAERLIRQGAKWEKEREIYDEMDRMKEVRRKEKREAELLREQEYANANRFRGIDLLRIKNRDYAENEMALKTFMDSERERMLCRTGAEAKRLKEKRLQQERDRLLKLESHQHEDFIYEGEEGEGEYEVFEDEFDNDEEDGAKDGIVQLHPPVAAHHGAAKKMLTDGQSGFAPESISTDQFATDNDIESYSPSITTLEFEEQIRSEEKAEMDKKHIVVDEDYLKYHYEDPKIVMLKRTDNVLDLYKLADEIIGGTAATQPKKAEHHD